MIAKVNFPKLKIFNRANLLNQEHSIGAYY